MILLKLIKVGIEFIAGVLNFFLGFDFLIVKRKTWLTPVVFETILISRNEPHFEKKTSFYT